jgi:hypothetical protein
MSEKVLENLDTVLDQLIQNASALNDEETPVLIEEQERLLLELMSLSREEREESLSPMVYGILDQKVRSFSSINRNRMYKKSIKR